MEVLIGLIQDLLGSGEDELGSNEDEHNLSGDELASGEDELKVSENELGSGEDDTKTSVLPCPIDDLHYGLIKSRCVYFDETPMTYDQGGFQLEFVSISRVINHMTCYNFQCSHWCKIYF